MLRRTLKLLSVLLLLLAAVWGAAVLAVRKTPAPAPWTPAAPIPALEAPTAEIIADVALTRGVRLTPEDVDILRALSLQTGDAAHALDVVTEYRRAAESLHP